MDLIGAALAHSARAVHQGIVDAGVTATSVGAVLTVLIILGKYVLQPLWREWREERAFRREFRGDWKGTPDRPGVPGRPGVMSQLLENASNLSQMAAQVRKLEREVLMLRARVMFLLKAGGHDPLPVTEDERG